MAIGIAALLFVINLEVSGLANRATHIDEYYFSACAARGLDIGEFPVAACHDNKGPVIYFLYQVIFDLTGLYNYTAVKAVAYTFVFLEVMFFAGTAYRLAGFVASAITASLLLLCFASDAGNLALKTDLVGGAFTAIALWVLGIHQAFRSYARLALSGFMIGIAVVTKQPFAFAGFGVIFWMFLSEPARSFAQARAFFVRSLVFGVCVLAPFLLFWLAFAFQNASTDYLLSFFLYPAIYGTSRGGGLTGLLRQVATMLGGLQEHFVLVGMTTAAAIALIFSEQSPAQTSSRVSDPRWLYLIVLLFLMAALTMTPVWLPSYIIIIAGPMALLSGIVFGDLWDRAWRSSPRTTFAVLTVLAVGAVISGANTWLSNGKLQQYVIPSRQPPADGNDSRTRYVYELGQEPDFYAAGGFIPASSVQFPWALPGTPARWSYATPRTDTFVGRLLAATQARNLSRLYADFARTPPSFILLQDNFVRTANSPNAVDIPGFQDYLDRNCKFVRQTEVEFSVSASLYECGDAAKPDKG